MLHLKERSKLLWALLFMLSSCASESLQELDQRTDLAAESGTDNSNSQNNDNGNVNDGGSGGDGGDGGTPSLLGEEVCDGFDNDQDGEIDEDLVAEVCATDSGSGTTHCVNGLEICRECTPGETRDAECGCGVDGTDRCNDVGRWVEGDCGGCSEATPPTCLELDACTPGDEKIQRCDQCTGTDCGSSCVGSLYRCSEICEWEQITPCEARSPECDRDLVLYEPCGKCGQQKLECDGCFWIPSDCSDQGVCSPGDTTATQCFEDSCADGLTALQICSDSCEWEGPTTCDGCVIGESTTATELCVPGFPSCGERVTKTECTPGEEVMSCAGPLPAGEMTTTVVSDSCQDSCVPGQTRNRYCETAGGQCGRYAQVCGVDCAWSGGGAGENGNGVCEVAPNACVPGTVQTEVVDCPGDACGATAVRTRTCRDNGCGWSTSTSSCPACDAGETDTRDCTTGSGACGERSRSCSASCEWGSFSACEPLPQSCNSGETRSQDCTAQCGLPGHQVEQCNGCGWQTIGQCEPNDASACEPGEVIDLGPCPLCPTQRKERRCGTDCQWVETSCGVCG